MPITLFDNDIPPYPNGRGPAPDELDEFAFLTRKELLRSLRHTGLLKADFTNGAWIVRRDADGTYSGAITDWKTTRRLPSHTEFAGYSESTAVDIATEWAHHTAG